MALQWIFPRVAGVFYRAEPVPHYVLTVHTTDDKLSGDSLCAAHVEEYVLPADLFDNSVLYSGRSISCAVDAARVIREVKKGV